MCEDAGRNPRPNSLHPNRTRDVTAHLALLLPPCPQGVSAAKPILHKKFLPTSHLSEKGLELVQVLEDAR